MKNLFEALPDGVLDVAADGTILAANGAARSLLGGDPTGASLGSLVDSLGGEQGSLSVGRWQRLDGGFVELEANSRQLDGHSLITLRDLSQRAALFTRLRDERAQLRAVLGAIPSLVLLLSPKGQVTRVNHAVRRHTGFSEEEFVGDPQTLWRMVERADRHWLRAAMHKALAGEAVVGDARLRVAGGSRMFELVVEPLGGRRGALILARPITRERELLGVFRQSARREATQVGLLAGTMAQDLQDGRRLLAQARQQLALFPPEDGLQNALEQVSHDLDRITRDMQHLGEDRSEPTQAVSVGGLLDRVVERLASSTGQGVRVECRNQLSNARVDADPAALVRVLHELGATCVRSVGGRGQVRFNARVRSGEMVLDVHHDGPFLDEKDLRELFQPFRRDSRGRPAENRLALVRGQLNRYGGEIEVSSEPQGTRFRVTLPLSSPAAVS